MQLEARIVLNLQMRHPEAQRGEVRFVESHSVGVVPLTSDSWHMAKSILVFTRRSSEGDILSFFGKITAL